MRTRVLYYLLIAVAKSLITDTSNKGEPSELVTLLAVTHFEGLQELYLRVQRQNVESSKKSAELRQIQQYPNIDSYIKESLCKNIFRSPYFDIRRDDVDLYVNEGRKSESNSFVSQLVLRWLPPWGRSKERNPYIASKITVNGTALNEFMFKCLVKDRFREPVDRYFISTAYNVNQDESEEYIAGRFIFARDRRKELVVYALAEEAASTFVSSSQNIELFYLEKRVKVRPTDEPEDDPICKLSNGDKLRLCTAVMNSPVYAGKLKFIPTMENVETRCERDVVSISVEEIFIDFPYLRTHTNLSIEPDTIFEEWMISCKAVTIDSKTPLHYYISRGYRSNRVFVYKLINRRLILDQYSADVSVISDN